MCQAWIMDNSMSHVKGTIMGKIYNLQSILGLSRIPICLPSPSSCISTYSGSTVYSITAHKKEGDGDYSVVVHNRQGITNRKYPLPRSQCSPTQSYQALKRTSQPERLHMRRFGRDLTRSILSFPQCVCMYRHASQDFPGRSAPVPGPAMVRCGEGRNAP